MRKDILDYPATNERPALWYFGVFQPSSDKTRLIKQIWIGTIYTSPSGPDECTKWSKKKSEITND